MWPWAHAGLGYLLYAGLRRARTGERPESAATLALALGTQLPDLVDKPLAWYLGALPYGRSLAHSLLLGGAAVALVAAWLSRRGDDDAAGGLLVGYLSHLLGDALQPLVAGEWREVGFVAWPLLPPPATEREGLLAHLTALGPDLWFLFGLVVTALAFAQWRRDGSPGLSTLRGWFGRFAPS